MNSSNRKCVSCNPTTIFNVMSPTTPGRNVQSFLEVPHPSDPVEPLAASDQHSRPGPAVGMNGGVFQNASSGKYSIDDVNLPSEVATFSSVATLPPPTHRASSAHGVTKEVLSVYYQNVHGLRTKIDEIFTGVAESDFDIIVLTETWLDEKIYSAQLFGGNYSVFRCDRSLYNSRKSRGGGVLIAVSARLSAYIDPIPICNTLEQIWIRVKLPHQILSVGVIYLPPSRRGDAISIRDHIRSVEAITSDLSFCDLVMLFGDYNQSGLVWSFPMNALPIVDSLQSSISVGCAALLDGFSEQNLVQINPVLNRNSRLLDLVLVNECTAPLCCVREGADPLIPLDADHPALEVTVHLSAPIEFVDIVDKNDLDYHKTDFISLSAALMRVDWRCLELFENVNDAVNYFTHTLKQLISDSVPVRKPPQKPPWGNAHLRRLKRLRSSALRAYSRLRCPLSKQQFSLASSNYRSYNRSLYRRYTLNRQASLRKNPKLFWSFVNSKKKEEGLPVSMFLNDETANTALEKCKLFAKHFKNSFNPLIASDAQINLAIENTPRDLLQLNIFHVTDHLVEKAIKKLKYTCSAGPDGIPSCILKKCMAALIRPLVTIFNSSLQQKVFPTMWKKTIMFPVHKKGDKRNVENYRGITSLCSCSKVFEIIVHEALFACSLQYISVDQHGFFPKRSVATNLTQFVTFCLSRLGDGEQVDTIYTDLKAAFDRVDHRILLSRIEKLGISADFIKWMRSYLTDRDLCVKIGSEESENFGNLSGVPQGSNLGPLLFTLFINEVSTLLPTGCRLIYADDVKIFAIINAISDCLKLQHLINEFEAWCTKNLLTLSAQKCNVITFHRKRNPIEFCYTILNHTLQRVDHIRDLGVNLDCALTFRPHYNEMVLKANRQLGFIFKIATEFRDPHCLRSLYCSLVRSILESCSVVWCPSQANWIARIESVQKKFLRYALRMLPWNNPSDLPPYEARCKLLGLETLEQRRTTAQAMFVAKLLSGQIDCPAILQQINLYAPERPLRTRNFLYLEPSRVNYELFNPVRYMAAQFNTVYDLFEFGISMDAFKRRLSFRR